jgi:hypothetical protein
MNVTRKLSLGCLLAVALAYSAVAAAPQGQPNTNAYPWSAATAATQVGPYNRSFSPSGQFAHQYVAADKPEEKRDLRKKLSDTLSQEFDLHIRDQQKELEDLEKQIASLRAVLKKRLDGKATIVERRVEQLIQEAEGLGWNAPSSPRGNFNPGYGPPGNIPSVSKTP